MPERVPDTAAAAVSAGSGRLFVERRQELRSPCDPIAARVETSFGEIPARVLDISRSGIRLEITTALPAPSEATVYFNNIIAVGEIRYCRSNGDASFSIGMQMQDVLTVA